MERLDELNLGVLGQTSGKEKDCPSVASPTTADHTASMMDVPQTSFDVLCQTLVPLGPAIWWEQDHSSSESVTWELPPGVLLCTALPTSALR